MGYSLLEGHISTSWYVVSKGFIIIKTKADFYSNEAFQVRPLKKGWLRHCYLTLVELTLPYQLTITVKSS